jgi:hypothetical protein
VLVVVSDKVDGCRRHRERQPRRAANEKRSIRANPSASYGKFGIASISGPGSR